MVERGEVASEVLAAVRAVCLGLPDAYEEPAWVGTRWRIRTKTFAHVLLIDVGWPPAYARAAGEDGPVTVLMFRSAGEELGALRNSGHPFFAPPWRADEIGMVIETDVDWAEVAELLTESYRALAPRLWFARSTTGTVPDGRSPALIEGTLGHPAIGRCAAREFALERDGDRDAGHGARDPGVRDQRPATRPRFARARGVRARRAARARHRIGCRSVRSPASGCVRARGRRPRRAARCSSTSRVSRPPSHRSSPSRSSTGRRERSRTRRRARCRPTSSPAERVPWVVARSSVTWQIATILGPVLGGFLYAADPQWPYVAVVVLMLASAALVLAGAGRTPASSRSSLLAVAADAVERPAARAHSCPKRSRGSGSYAASPSCSARSHSTCSPCCSAARSRCCRRSPRTGSTSARSASAGCARRGGIGAALVTLRLAVRPLGRHVGRWLLVRRRHLRCRDDRARSHPFVRDRVRRDVRARGRGFDQRVRAGDARAPRDAGVQARPRARRRGGLHRCVERAGRVRVRRGGPDPRAERGASCSAARRRSRSRCRGPVRSPRSEASIGSRRRSTTEPTPAERCRPAPAEEFATALTTFPPPCRNAFSP